MKRDRVISADVIHHAGRELSGACLTVNAAYKFHDDARWHAQ